VLPETETNDPWLTPRRAPSIGDVIQGWRLEALLGEGGSACVFAATHADGRRAAVKVLRAELASHLTLVARFFGDGQIAALLDHPGVVRRLDEGVTASGVPFLVVERLDGETLEQRIKRRGPLPVAEAVSVCAALLDVLAAAHARGVVHRDIKPDNLFLTEDGEVKLIDFGVAREPRTMDAGRTLDQMIIGTPAFMPPEQARGRWSEVDARSDLWAAGATFFRAVTGRHLRTSQSTIELLADATLPLPPMSELAPELAPPLAAWLDRALAHERMRRFVDAVDMSAALDEAMAADRWVSQVRVRTTRRAKVARGGRRLLGVVLAAAVVTVLVPAALLSSSLPHPDPAGPEGASFVSAAPSLVAPPPSPVKPATPATPAAETRAEERVVPVESLPLAPWAPAPPAQKRP
jgi:serine/threonine-protein kinase